MGMLQHLNGQDLIDAQDRITLGGDPTRPVLVGNGPAEFSTSMALEPWPSLIWDTNCFYYDLGVHCKASRVEIRKAYQAKGGERNVRLTMIVGVLLNAEHRLAYDRVPLGSFYFDDEIEEAVRHEAAASAAGQAAEGNEVDVDALNEYVDSLRTSADDANALPAYQPRHRWSYYLHNSECNDTDLLAEWRSAIIQALWDLDLTERLGIGFAGQMEEEFLVCVIGYRMVLLVNDTLPCDIAMASEAAKVIATNQTKQTPIHT